MADATEKPEGDRPPLTAERVAELDLEQALIDLEIANARVIDLTSRLTSMSAEVLRLRAEVGNLQLVRSLDQSDAVRLQEETAALRSQLAAVQRPLVYRVARRLGRARTQLVRR